MRSNVKAWNALRLLVAPAAAVAAAGAVWMSSAAFAAEPSPAVTGRPVRLQDDLGSYSWPITTRSPAAQRYFDQGLRLYYGFNLPEATRSFQEAARLDPDAAMAWWGIALAAGPNYNSPIDPERNTRALEAIAKAKGAAGHANPVERDLVAALAARYSPSPDADRQKLDRAYVDAMRDVVKRHPDDLDVATLYAESLMDLRPWDLWTVDGKPQPGTEEVVTVLEGVLRRDPQHPGANHLYIHAVEASPHPERGLASAKVIETAEPGAGHLVHMPSHIYMRTGRYAQATEANRKAVEVDRAYIAREQPTGEYVMMYYPHNLDFLWSAASMEGRSGDALRAAREVAREAPPEMLREMPEVEGVAVTPTLVLVRFGRFDEALAEPPPPAELRFASGLDHYARGIALTRKGRLDDARAELKALDEITAAMPADRVVMQVTFAKTVLTLARETLAGEIDAASGNTDAAVAHLTEAVRLQDNLRYMEPPPWYFPVRQALGAVLLAGGRPAEAEKVYLADLARNPENGWSLFGLAASLEAQGRKEEAAAAQARFRTSWARADVPLKASVF